MNAFCRIFRFGVFRDRSLGFLVLVLTVFASTSRAAPIFSQTISDHESFDGASASDRDSLSTGLQLADDVVLTSSATARSVTWWGVFGPFNNTPVTPVWFELIFYADSGGLPDPGNVISSTSVSLTSLTDTGVDLNGEDVYEFRANLTPTLLPAGTRVWFSVLADTSNDPDDSFLWRFDQGAPCARRSDVTLGAFTSNPNVVPLFVLDDAAIPEPSLTITSFTPLGNGVFELSLEGADSTPYEFRSSPTLEFTPGTLVSGLTKGEPTDPGTISGIDSSTVTTDGNGNAKVRINLFGPRNFVRAQRTE